MADGSRHAMYLIPEVTYNTTPATTPAMQRIRLNSTTLGTNKGTLMSEELRSDRQLIDFRQGQNEVGGNLVLEPAADARLDLMFEALLAGSWATNTLKAGTTRRSFSMLRQFEDMPGTEKAFHLFTGVEMAGLTFKAGANQIPKLTFDVIAGTQTTSTAGPSGATYGAASTTPVMDAFTGAVTEGGTANGVVTEVGFKLTNNMKRRFVIGSKNTLRPEWGRSIVDGTLSTYFETTALYEKFMADTSSSLSFTISASSKSYQFTLPNIKYTAGSPDVAGEGAIIVPMTFQAVYDATSTTNIQIVRVP